MRKMLCREMVGRFAKLNHTVANKAGTVNLPKGAKVVITEHYRGKFTVTEVDSGAFVTRVPKYKFSLEETTVIEYGRKTTTAS